MNPTTEPGALCIGRFRLQVPPGWEVAGRSQRQYLIELDDQLPPPAAGADPVLAQLRHGLTATTPLIRQFELEGVGPAAWFGLGRADSVDRRLVALAGPPAAPLRLQALATQGREAVAEKALRQVAAGYQAGARNGFCLARGAMQLEPSRNETTTLSLVAPRLTGAHFTLDTRAVDKPDESHPLAHPEAELAGSEAAGLQVHLQPKVARTVAGLSGQEFRGEASRGRGPPSTLIYRFYFAGSGRQPAAPMMALSLDGAAEDRAALEAAWNGLLDSLQPTPLR